MSNLEAIQKFNQEQFIEKLCKDGNQEQWSRADWLGGEHSRNIYKGTVKKRIS